MDNLINLSNFSTKSWKFQKPQIRPNWTFTHKLITWVFYSPINLDHKQKQEIMVNNNISINYYNNNNN